MSAPRPISENKASVIGADQFLRDARECMVHDVKKAYTLALKAKELSEKAFDRAGYARALSVLGQCSERFSDYVQALEHSLEAMQIFRGMGDKKGESDCLNTLGGVYNYLGDHESRLTCNLQTLKLRREAGDRHGEITSLNNIGDTYIKLGQFEKALECFNQCLALEHITERHRTILTHNIGETYFFMKEYTKAEPYFMQSIPLSIRTSYKSITCIGNIFLAEIYLMQDRLHEASQHLEESLTLARSLNSKEDIMSIYRNYAVLYEKKKNTENAFRYFKLYHELKEEIYSEANIRKIKNLQFQYEMEGLRRETEAERDKNLRLREAYERIERQKNEIARKNIAITDSIRYAKRLQEALLPPETLIQKFFPDHLVLYKPKDIVSGDFYWCEQWGNQVFVGAVDCTGHGVPGAFMSIAGVNLFNRALNEHGISKPSLILNAVNKGLSVLLRQNADENLSVKDGMDVALVSIDLQKKHLEFAGAYSPLYLVRNKKLKIIKGDRFPIGAFSVQNQMLFRNHELALQSGDCIYLFSDGYTDQFGGHHEKKFKHSRLQEKLLEIHALPMAKQKEILENTFTDWKGNLEQVDDVLIVGIRI